MNAVDLVARIKSITRAPGVSDTSILSIMNRAQRYISTDLLIPGLDTGHDTVTTDPAAYSVGLPGNYGKNIFLAKFDGNEVHTFKDIKGLSIFMGGLVGPDDENGDVVAVSVNAGRLVYQRIPVNPAEIELYYYRKAEDMELSTDSFPDGLPDNDFYDSALVAYCCREIYSTVEDGVDGRKVNSEYHDNQFQQHLARLRLFCAETGESYPSPKFNKLW